MSQRKEYVREYKFGPLYEDANGDTRIDLRGMGETYVRAHRALLFERAIEADRQTMSYESQGATDGAD